MNITKETFLKAEDPKNRDAMLYDMLAGIAEKIEECNKMKEEVDGFKAQVSFVKRLFLAVATIFTAVSAWLAKS
ncbi:MAG: hypothetical protein IMF19_04515 [Proteobacteria bacterium]|nr:hypothetical protein [Pseudomonadota bacterium]